MEAHPRKHDRLRRLEDALEEENRKHHRRVIEIEEGREAAMEDELGRHWLEVRRIRGEVDGD